MEERWEDTCAQQSLLKNRILLPSQLQNVQSAHDKLKLFNEKNAPEQSPVPEAIRPRPLGKRSTVAYFLSFK